MSPVQIILSGLLSAGYMFTISNSMDETMVFFIASFLFVNVVNKQSKLVQGVGFAVIGLVVVAMVVKGLQGGVL